MGKGNELDEETAQSFIKSVVSLVSWHYITKEEGIRIINDVFDDLLTFRTEDDVE